MVLVATGLNLMCSTNESVGMSGRVVRPNVFITKTQATPWDQITKVSKSLSRTLSLPRRCRICGKIVYFRSFRCRVCNSVSHRQCVGHTDQSNNTILQSNKVVDIHSEPVCDTIHNCGLNRAKTVATNKECAYRRESIPAENTGHRLHEEMCNHQVHVMGLKTPIPSLKKKATSPELIAETCPPTSTLMPRSDGINTSSSNGSSGSGFYRRLVCWLRSRKTLRHDSEYAHYSSGNHEHALCEKYMKGKYGLKTSESQMARKRLKLLLSGDVRGWPMQWQGQERGKREGMIPHGPCHQKHCHGSDTNVLSQCSCSGNVHRDSGISSLSSSVAQTPSCDCDNRVTIDSSCSSSKTRCFHSKPSSNVIRDPLAAPHSDGTHYHQGLRQNSCADSPYLHHAVHSTVPAECFGAGLLKEKTIANMAHTVHLFCGQLDEGRFGHRCPSKTRTLSLESKTGTQEDLCATWPPVGRKIFTNNDDAFEGSESGFEDYDNDDDSNSANNQSHSNEKDSLGEWSIPFKDLKFGRQVRRGRRHDIYRGRWHGEVMIHIFHTNSEQETTQFWKEVTSLSMIRHENVALFMGVCIDMPQLAIVTSVRKGSSLYDHIHVKKDHFPLPYKVHIARQVAQGMSYLHAKGIIHRKLNSKNILLETKAKVSLLDQGMAVKDLDRVGYGCVPNGHLTYVSPEIMRSLRVKPPKIVPTVSYTKYSDVFAFGTMLYELFGEQWPFQGQRAHAVIWQVGRGNLQSLDGLKCSAGIKSLVSECWSNDITSRPNFHHILKTLQQNVLLQRRHSTSEPDNLNRLGFGQGLLPC